MESDVFGATVTGNGVAFAGRTRLKGFTIAHAATGGNVVFRNEDGSGTTLLTIATPAVAGSMTYELPGNGILFPSGVHVTVGDASSVTVLLG